MMRKEKFDYAQKQGSEDHVKRPVPTGDKQISKQASDDSEY